MTGQHIAKEPRFITLEEALSLHESAIDAHGGSYGLRDQGLLESALAAPRQGFGGQYAYAFPYEMAAAYLFHLCKNHAFIDGNKRIAWVCAVFFMRVNGWSVLADETEAVDVVLRVATDQMDKSAVAAWLMRFSRPRPAVELREFFRGIQFTEFHTAFQSISPNAPGGGQGSAVATLEEAAKVAPFMQGVIQGLVKAEAEKRETDRQVALAVLKSVAALVRIAEDQGYEW